MPYDLKDRPQNAGYKMHSDPIPIIHPTILQTARKQKHRNFADIYPLVYTVDLSNKKRIELEQGFILDGNAIDNIRSDYHKQNPKKGDSIPPYNAQKDYEVRTYFKYRNLNPLLRKTKARTKEFPQGTSMLGKYDDKFYYEGELHEYITRRNAAGAGHFYEDVKGHAFDLRDVKPYFGFNGNFGFRRNTPQMRYNPFIMGPTCPFALY